MSIQVQVRAATVADAPTALEVLRASITELCIDDHQNDRETLDRWLENKTVSNFERWVNDSENVLVVAEVDGKMAGVGLVRSSGDVYLCYVRPGMVRSGVGSAILARLEQAARTWELAELRLSSSLNARSFYERHGYVAAGESSVAFGVVRTYPYRKRA